MASLVEDLGRLKAQGAPVEDREHRLEQGSLELHTLLGAVSQGQAHSQAQVHSDVVSL